MNYEEVAIELMERAQQEANRLNARTSDESGYPINEFNVLAKGVELTLRAAQVYATLATIPKTGG